MNVGISARAFTVDEPGGAVQSARMLTRSLAERTPTTFFGHTSVSKLGLGGEVVDTAYPIDSALWGLVYEQTGLPVEAHRHDVDVLFSPNTYCPPTPCAFPKVVMIHSLTSYEGFSSLPYRLFRRTGVPASICSADRVVTVSEFLADEIVERFGTQESKVDVVYNGIDPVFMQDDPGQEVRGLPEDYILFVGTFSRNKNVSGVLRAYDMLREQYGVDMKLVMVGSADNAAVDSVRTAFKQEDVILPGYISTPERLKYVYENADALVFPSYYESFGLPPLEAMACGTPVIASDRTACPEICGDAAIFVDPEDTAAIAQAMYDLVSDRDRANELVAKGKKRATRFTWDRAGATLESVLLDVVDEYESGA